MRFSEILNEIEISARRRFFNNIQHEDANEVHILYDKIKLDTDNFQTPARIKYNQNYIFDMNNWVDDHQTALSEIFKPTDDIMIALKELSDYFNY